MGGGGRKRQKDKQRRSCEPATIVIDLRVDLHAGGAVAEAAGAMPAAIASADGVVSDCGSDHRPAGEAPDAISTAADLAGPPWPLGPHYLRWVEGKGVDAWARFKLRSADWYLDALDVAAQEVGLDRFVGVEMAIDGVLSSLCAGVDAAGHALLDEVERLVGPSALRARRHLGEDWTLFVDLAEEAGIGLGSTRAVRLAVDGDDEAGGWLTELQRLRALAVRRNVLVRRPNVDGAARSRLLDVPELGQRPVVHYLRKARRRANGLVEALLADVEGLAHERRQLSPRPSHAHGGLKDLSVRAGLPGASRHGSESG